MKKALTKKIRQIANDLPEMTYVAYPKHYDYSSVDDFGNKMSPQKRLFNRKVEYRVNHYRRLKRLVEKLGFDEGVKRYLRAIKLSEK